MKYLGFTEKELSYIGGIHTAKEIVQQPSVWREVFANYSADYDELNDFFDKAIEESNKIILTGAGTSAYIGLSLKSEFMKNRKICTFSVPTTDIISHPNDFFFENETIILVSFARSGNSPESVGTVEFADKLCKKVFHLVITCAEEGELANYESKNPYYTFLLPSIANDKSLAMTSSYSGMMLAGLLIAENKGLTEQKDMVNLLCKHGNEIIINNAKHLFKLSEMDFIRAVFLGSGELYGVAKESHLKLQELTDGTINCTYDSFLGFRHGPKAVVDEKTLIVYLFSFDHYVHKYELDLVSAMDKGKKPLFELGVSESVVKDVYLDQRISFDNSGNKNLGPYFPICAVLPAQILGFYKSIQLGLKPDSPSKSGSISRVVEGVQIYPV